jgi:hypothetical protein
MGLILIKFGNFVDDINCVTPHRVAVVIIVVDMVVMIATITRNEFVCCFPLITLNGVHEDN